MDIQIEREREEHGFKRMMNFRDIRNVLGLSSAMVAQLIRSGQLDCYNVSGIPIDREGITEDTRGVRITPESLEDYLNTIRI